MFKELDSNGNGRLELVELGEMLVKLGQHKEDITPEMLQTAMSAIDKGNKGCVDFTRDACLSDDVSTCLSRVTGESIPVCSIDYHRVVHIPLHPVLLA